MIDPNSLIGIPYEAGARGPDTYDCWGLVLALCPQLPDPWRDAHFSLRKTIKAMVEGVHGQPYAPVEQPGHGDVGLFASNRLPHHCGVFWGDEYDLRVVHALPGVGVTSHKPAQMDRLGLKFVRAYRWAG